MAAATEPTPTTIRTRPTDTDGNSTYFLVTVAAALFFFGCSPSEPPGLPLATIETSLQPVAKPLAAPQPGDWLSAHHENGQTFAEYLRLKPQRHLKAERTI